MSYLSDESTAVSFDWKLPRDKNAMNDLLLEFASHAFITNETETKSASELNVVVTPKNKGKSLSLC